ncbi:MAG: peptide deformylase [Candidatus Dojkabacteria bacterium]|nr:peptide deformylase [Candidatus Dojkabacteria bacterium]
MLKESVKVERADIDSKETRSLIKDLLDTCKANFEDAAGLSAVQIGVLKRVFVVKRTDLEDEYRDQWEVMINPNIKILDKKESLIWEGCLSINTGENRLYGPVYRPKKVRIEYYDQKGNKRSLDADGFFSHLIQHELDHLNGILFLSHVENPANIWKEDEFDKYLKENRQYPPIV